MALSGIYLLQQLANGLVLGGTYALLAIGFSMIYGVLGLVNFAHGDVIMIGAFVALGLLVGWNWPFLGVLVAVLVVGAVIGMVIERIAFRPIRNAPQVTGFITSLALSILLQNLGILILSPQPRTFRIPETLSKLANIGGVVLRYSDLVTLLLAILAVAGLTVLVRRTKIGLAIRAVSINPAVASLMGIRVDQTIVFTFALGSALATLAGTMWAARVGQIDPLMGTMPGLKSFVAAVIGGIGSIPGAVLGSLVLGLAEVLFVGLLPPVAGSYRDAFVFALLLIVLIFRPEGLWKHESGDRS